MPKIYRDRPVTSRTSKIVQISVFLNSHAWHIYRQSYHRRLTSNVKWELLIRKLFFNTFLVTRLQFDPTLDVCVTYESWLTKSYHLDPGQHFLSFPVPQNFPALAVPVQEYPETMQTTLKNTSPPSSSGSTDEVSFGFENLAELRAQMKVISWPEKKETVP